MKKRNLVWVCLFNIIVSALFVASAIQAADNPQGTKGAQKEALSAGVEVSTEEVKQILLAGRIPVIDVRPLKEYAVSHIPGSVNIFETEIGEMMKANPDKSAGPVLYCNGPYCGKTVRVAERLAKNGHSRVMRYQQGLPIWRAFGNTAETSLPGFKYVYGADKTAVFVDARSKDEYKAGTIAGAVNIQNSGEIEAANNDGRLPYMDHGTRVVVFGSTISQAQKLAEGIARRAYWNSSYLAGTYEDLKKLGLH